MALRFRRSIKLAPGVRMNVSGAGISWTLGAPGASLGIGKRGTYLNAGLVGTGIGTRERLAAPPSPERPATTATVSRPAGSKTAIVRIEDDGSVRFIDDAGNPLGEEWQKLAKAQGAAAISQFLREACDRCNADVDAIINIHLTTPAPVTGLHYSPGRFVEVEPSAPVLRRPHWWLTWLASHRDAINATNEDAEKTFKARLATWQAQKDAFEDAERRRQQFIEHDLLVSSDAREQWIDEQLSAIVWPRETQVSYELSPSGSEIVLDVDLPEIEDMPSRTARPAERGIKVIYKPFGVRTLELNYARHIHGLLLRLVGEMFASLPMLSLVTVSGYTQRPDAASGHLDDEYLLSLRVRRNQWTSLNFEALAQLDPLQAVARFDHRRDMSAGGRFKRIEPFASSET